MDGIQEKVQEFIVLEGKLARTLKLKEICELITTLIEQSDLNGIAPALKDIIHESEKKIDAAKKEIEANESLLERKKQLDQDYEKYYPVVEEINRLKKIEQDLAKDFETFSNECGAIGTKINEMRVDIEALEKTHNATMKEYQAHLSENESIFKCVTTDVRLYEYAAHLQTNIQNLLKQYDLEIKKIIEQGKKMRQYRMD